MLLFHFCFVFLALVNVFYRAHCWFWSENKREEFFLFTSSLDVATYATYSGIMYGNCSVTCANDIALWPVGFFYT